MNIKHQLTLARLLAKVDNDFNLSESDWIPRVGAWVIDALSQMKVLPMERKKRRLEVSDRIAQFPCSLNVKDIKVYDKNCVEIKEAKSTPCCSGKTKQNVEYPEIAVIDDTNLTGVNFMKVGYIPTPRAVGGVSGGRNCDCERNYVIDCDNIELNFDTDEIIVESYEVATYYDEYYECECPYIIDDGLLLEALAWYVLFKYLSRGSKHPVYDLKSNSPVTNPWIQWNTLRPKAAASAKIALSKGSGDGWNNFFYNSTFLPRS